MRQGELFYSPFNGLFLPLLNPTQLLMHLFPYTILALYFEWKENTRGGTLMSCDSAIN